MSQIFNWRCMICSMMTSEMSNSIITISTWIKPSFLSLYLIIKSLQMVLVSHLEPSAAANHTIYDSLLNRSGLSITYIIIVYLLNNLIIYQIVTLLVYFVEGLINRNLLLDLTLCCTVEIQTLWKLFHLNLMSLKRRHVWIIEIDSHLMLSLGDRCLLSVII